MALADQRALPDAARADVGEDLEKRRDDEPEGLRLREELGVFLRLAEMGRHRDDDRQEEYAGNQTPLYSNSLTQMFR